MFRFADTTDFTYVWFGSVAALAAGAVMPFFSFIFGDVALIYVKPDPIGESLKIAIKFWLLAAAAWVLSTTCRYCRLCLYLLLDNVRGTPMLALPSHLLQAAVETGSLLVRYYQSQLAGDSNHYINHCYSRRHWRKSSNTIDNWCYEHTWILPGLLPKLEA